ncbi:hypothetical protein F511_27790 [Dorcoceras hygrometricum]|uniref:Uncharacterized protein n=1 Tax=Dorcoceras hygrometricum TaxID=472368 RepID=A0A2Z7CG30_9LAMI|nr:hypothetical protein F511_27790 [Dorcoceras hygrometricum]
MTGRETPSSACTRRPDEISVDGFSSKDWPEQIPAREAATRRSKGGGGGGGDIREGRGGGRSLGARVRVVVKSHSTKSSSSAHTLSLVSVRESRIQYLCDPQWFRDTASRITDSACKNQLVVVSVQYGPFNPYIPIRSTTIGKSRVAKDPIAMHTSWRSNSDIASVTSIGYPRMSASGESSTTMHRLLHASGSHPIPPPNEPKTNQYNQDLGLVHSTNGNHLESPNEGSSIDHQVTIYLHAQNITMFTTNETWYFASQILVSSSGGLYPHFDGPID